MMMILILMRMFLPAIGSGHRSPLLQYFIIVA